VTRRRHKYISSFVYIELEPHFYAEKNVNVNGPVPETLASIYAGKKSLQNLIVSAGRDIGKVW